MIEELKETSKLRYASPYSIAIIYIALKMFDEAFEWLERAYEEHSDWLVWLRVGPEFDHIRSDPRFADLLRRVGFPE